MQCRSARVRREIERGLGFRRDSNPRDRWWSQHSNSNAAKRSRRMKRLKSFSCPQLLISSECGAEVGSGVTGFSGSTPPVSKLARTNPKTTRFMLSMAFEKSRTLDSGRNHLRNSETSPMMMEMNSVEKITSVASFPDSPLVPKNPDLLRIRS